jgi:hypothetical protein
MDKQKSGAATFLSDNETKVDLLNNEAIALTIIKILLEAPDKPVTIGVHGDWGVGKSSILEMIESGLEVQKNILCLKFNGWRFQGFEDAKIALLEGIVTGLIEKRPELKKAGDKVKEVFRRIDWLKIAKHAGSLAFTAFTGIPNFAQIHDLIKDFEKTLRDPATRPSQDKVNEMFDNALSLVKTEVQSKNIPDEIDEFRKAFDDLLKEAKVERLIVLIDDLDRCLPDTAIETLEAIRLFVFTPHTAFVVAADEAMIEYSVRKHFPELPDSTGPQTYARNYLEKLIQVPFRIPPLGVAETRIYVSLLLIGAELGDEDEGFAKLIVAARNRLKRPWSGEVIDTVVIKDTLGEKANKANQALFLSDQIGPILTGGTKGNPRQIKRFLNALMLRKRTADARGFGEDITLPALAKLMLAEQFLPRLFEQIANKATSSSTGICNELKLLEEKIKSPKMTPEAGEDEGLREEKSPKKHSKVTAEKETENSLLEEWLSNKPVEDWVAIEPLLGNIDLRPYFFATKDHKNYFGTHTTLGHINTITEKLIGPKISVQALEGDLKRLAIAEADQVFEGLRSHIISVGKFDNPPDGIDGISVLVKVQPTLQPKLLDLLDGLPSDHLGMWAIQGWTDVITEPENEKRLKQIFQKWADNPNNPLLQVAAGQVAKIPKRGR